MAGNFKIEHELDFLITRSSPLERELARCIWLRFLTRPSEKKSGKNCENKAQKGLNHMRFKWREISNWAWTEFFNYSKFPTWTGTSNMHLTTFPNKAVWKRKCENREFLFGSDRTNSVYIFSCWTVLMRNWSSSKWIKLD